MSPQSSSKSYKNHKKRKSTSHSSSSLADQLEQKNPDAFKKLLGFASEANPDRKNPKFLPGSLSSTRPSQPKIKQRQKKKAKTVKKNIPNKYSPDKAKKYLTEVFGDPYSKNKESSSRSKAPTKKTLVELFSEIDLTDSVSRDAIELSTETKNILSSWAQAFRALSENKSLNTDNPVYITIGFDFGTSSAKVIVRFPYESEEPSFALPVPAELRADGHPHCWKTLLWIEPGTGQLTLSYKNGFEPITDIKTAAMADSSIGGQSAATSAGMTPEITCLAYIGLMLRIVKGWIGCDILPKLGISPNQRQIYWELNMGLPASKKDDPKIASRFNGIAKYAWNLSNHSMPLFAKDIQFLIFPQEEEHINADISIRPEVVAQTIGFVQADIADFGYYATIDVGASTLDVCTFNFVNSKGEDRFNLFFSNVKLLGSEAANWIDIVNRQFEYNFQSSDLKLAIKACFGETVIETKLKKIPDAKIWSSSLPVFLCGGGRYSIIHNEALSEYSNNYNLGTFGDLDFRDIAIPKNLKFTCAENEYHRLSVAWGLSITAFDFNNYTMPSDIDEVKRASKKDISDLYIGPEQV